jgi:hypothetical protein
VGVCCNEGGEGVTPTTTGTTKAGTTKAGTTNGGAIPAKLAVDSSPPGPDELITSSAIFVSPSAAVTVDHAVSYLGETSSSLGVIGLRSRSGMVARRMRWGIISTASVLLAPR